MIRILSNMFIIMKHHSRLQAVTYAKQVLSGKRRKVAIFHHFLDLYGCCTSLSK